MNREEKAKIIDDIAGKLQSGSAVLVDYQGMNVSQSTDLRRRSRESGVEFLVAKNTLTRMAADRAGVSELNEYLVGPTAIAFSEDPVASAKLMAEFADLVESFDLKAGLLDGEKVLGEDEVVALSKLPSREQLIAQIVGGIGSPLTSFVTVLNNTIQGLVVALGQIAEQKQQQS
ncbi:Ribosomal protein L10 [Rubrobacter radiotolerans]|uniref:Large ribosomal subunit protein uL10 n=1 Tax=Rubrobacter radiotolerans TaxID=42256 RepID=A0A023X5F4_RUBRA|nr:50S ribosomal protein L10 [Rubrobacter radiotolerans]AHY47235.1 Ribosomal protein L10 [Rubrobacter radiotolerans]MDX5894638.1 50S ribosomal protein L10 [Rubrobacter radiotolerans]SMC06447.1 LSU ribosomal protein L10P [Rubrobacter radiotolerans DSM 5868]